MDGTKTEMERLLRKAEEIEGYTKGSLSVNSFADIVDAIHIVQEEMGITGTTAKEASTTIQGSVSSMKSAWQNMLTGIADDNANFDNLINNLVDSIVTAAKNILPRVEVIIDGIIELILSMSQILLEHLPEIFNTGSQMLQGFIDGIMEMIPNLLPVIVEITSSFVQFVAENLSTIINAGVQIILAVVKGIAESIPNLIPTVVDAVITIVENLIDNIDMIIDTGIQLILGLADGLIEALPRLIEKIPVIIDKLVNAITNNLPKIIEAGITLIIKLAEGLIKAIPQLVSKIPQIIKSIVNGFANYFSNMKDIGTNLVKGIWNGISNATQWILDKIKGFGQSILNGIKGFFGIHSPSTLFRDEVGKLLAEGIGEGFSDEMQNVTDEMQQAIPTQFDVSSSLTGSNNLNSNFSMLKAALVEAFREFKPVVILNGKEIGEFAFEYGNIKYGKYYG